MPRRGPGHRVPGHGLLRDPFTGPARYGDDGQPGTCGELAGRVMCECGELSAPGLTNHQALMWHVDHRGEQRSLGEGERDVAALLTPRERDVVNGLLRGLSRQQVAEELGVTYMAVAQRLYGALRRTGCADQEALFAALAAQGSERS